MTERIRHQLFLPKATSERLEALARKPGASKSAILADAVTDVTGIAPDFSTGGGTSDARFIKNYCPVAELGLVGETMHKVDEQAPVADIATLQAIYLRVLERYFGTPAGED